LSLIGLFICIHQHKQKDQSKNSSTNTISSVRVSDTNSCLYYPRRLYYNDETTGVYSIQGKKFLIFMTNFNYWFILEKKNSVCFDSGIPSITSNNSDSIESSDFYDRSDGEYLVNGRLSTYIPNRGRENHVNIPINGRISSEEESGFSTPTKTYHGKKLVYEVIVWIVFFLILFFCLCFCFVKENTLLLS